MNMALAIHQHYSYQEVCVCSAAEKIYFSVSLSLVFHVSCDANFADALFGPEFDCFRQSKAQVCDKKYILSLQQQIENSNIQHISK